MIQVPLVWPQKLLQLVKGLVFYYFNALDMIITRTCSFSFNINLFIYLSFYFWLRWVFVAAHGLPLVAAASLVVEHGL